MIIIGVILGSIGGYAYYYFVGCASGSCAITSNPINSTAYGALMEDFYLAVYLTAWQKRNRMTSFWDERYSDTEFVYGKDPNVFLQKIWTYSNQAANYFFGRR